jgi:hypothetical protein
MTETCGRKVANYTRCRDKAFIQSLVPEVVSNVQGRQVVVEGEGEEEDEKPNKLG